MRSAATRRSSARLASPLRPQIRSTEAPARPSGVCLCLSVCVALFCSRKVVLISVQTSAFSFEAVAEHAYCKLLYLCGRATAFVLTSEHLFFVSVAFTHTHTRRNPVKPRRRTRVVQRRGNMWLIWLPRCSWLSRLSSCLT